MKRKKKISILNGPQGQVTENQDMLQIATDFYKNLFGHEDKPDIHLSESFWEVSDLLTAEENKTLSNPLSEEEIKLAIFYSYADGAPGPDGFPFLFYQKFWDLIKADFMALVKEFNNGSLDISRFNYVILTLIPKEDEATELKKN